MKVLQIGNFGPDHSTENELRKALGAIGVEVVPVQENEPGLWTDPVAVLSEHHPHWVLWTRTGWDWKATCGWSHEEAVERQHGFLAACRAFGIPTVGYHLDRWWGLDRQGQVHVEPFFRVDLLVTADGGHDEEWRAAGVNHHWMPPGVSEFECGGARYNAKLASPIAFVGSWRPGYHPEWQHRPQLVDWLRSNYGRMVRFWGGPGRAVRGAALRSLYASVAVVVGDSCLVGSSGRYFSDRIPETLGRGGFLIHPQVEGLEEHWQSGVHLQTWPIGDWGELRQLVDSYLADSDGRRGIAHAGRLHTVEHHTYTVRMRQLLALMATEGMVPAPVSL